MNVDQLQSETSLEKAATMCGASIDAHGSGNEVRLNCPFGCAGDHHGRREIAVNTENPQKVFLCHSYQCGFRGNLLTLMHGWLTNSKPSGDKLKGDEFHRVKKILANETGGVASTTRLESTPAKSTANSPPPVIERNNPLLDSADEKVRELATLDQKFVIDVAKMAPAPASYVRRHLCLTPTAMTKWRVGVLPTDGGGDKRGFSLRSQIIYPVLSEDGKVLAWVGRDPNYEQKERDFARLSPAERTAGSAPIKYRFPKGFHRGVELFGQHSIRLKEPNYREFIQQNGLILVEGFNDVINLDTHGIPALAIMSNRMTEAQGEKVIRFAKQLGINRVNLMFDCDEPGAEGAKDALWYFAERKLDVRLAWSSTMHGGEYKGSQPESLKAADLATVIRD